MSAPHYHINLFWSDADNAWIADVPDLGGCNSRGETPEQALGEVRTAMDLWIEVAREDGKAIPEPRYTAEIYTARQAA